MRQIIYYQRSDVARLRVQLRQTNSRIDELALIAHRTAEEEAELQHLNIWSSEAETIINDFNTYLDQMELSIADQQDEVGRLNREIEHRNGVYHILRLRWRDIAQRCFENGIALN